jgi:hypothetical protein
MLVAMDGVWTQLALAGERQRISAIERIAQGNMALSAVQKRARDMERDVNEVLKRKRDAIGDQADWSAVMRIVSESAPSNVRVQGLTMNAGGMWDGRSSPVGAIRAYARTSVQDSAPIIRQFAESLGACPLIGAVRLGATQRIMIRGEEAQSFELQFVLVGLPLDALQSAPAEETEQRP